MTIKQLKEVIAKAEASGVPENTQVYSEQARSNETDCLLIVRDKEKEEVQHVYLSDSSPDDLRMCLEDNDYIVETIY